MTAKCHIYFLNIHQENEIYQYVDKKTNEIIFKKLPFNQEIGIQESINIIDLHSFDKKINDNKRYSSSIFLQLNDKMYQSAQFYFILSKSNFIFDLSFPKEINKKKRKLNFVQQIKSYIQFLEFLKKKNLNEYPNTKNELIYDSIAYLNNKKKTNQIILFEDFLVLFVECYSTQYVQQCLNFFSMDIISSQNLLNINSYKTILEEISSQKELLLTNVTSKNLLVVNNIYYTFCTILIYFYYHYTTESVLNLFNQKKHRKLYLRILTSNPKMFKRMPKEIISRLIGYCKYRSQCSKLLQMTQHVSTAMNIIIDNSEIIKQLSYNDFNQKDKEKNNLIIIKEENYVIEGIQNLEETTKSWKRINKLKEADKSLNFISIDLKILEKYISSYKNEDIKILFSLKKKLKQILLPEEYNNILQFLKTKIVKYYQILIKKRKLVDSELFLVILEFKEAEWINEIKDEKIFGNVRKENQNENFYTLFKLIDFESIYQDKFVDFFNELLNSIPFFNYISFIFKILHTLKKENYSLYYPHIVKRINTLLEEEKDKKDISNSNIEKIIITILDDKQLNTFVDTLEKVIDKTRLVEIYRSLLPKVSYFTKTISKRIIKYLVDNIKEKNNNSDPSFFLNSIKEDEEKLIFFFDEIKTKIITQKDFFNSTLTDNYALFQNLVSQHYFSLSIKSALSNTDYISQTKQKANEFCQLIEDRKIKKEEAKNLDKSNIKNEKILKVCLLDNQKRDKIIKALEKVIEELEKYDKQIKEVQKFNNFFDSETKDRTRALSEIEKIINTKTISEYDKLS